MGLVFSGLMIWQISHSNEKEDGTARLFLKYMYYQVMIQSIFAIFGVLIVFGLFDVVRIYSSGFWAVYFVLLTLRCMKNPEGYSQ
jgi:hypothetical protein